MKRLISVCLLAGLLLAACADAGVETPDQDAGEYTVYFAAAQNGKGLREALMAEPVAYAAGSDSVALALAALTAEPETPGASSVLSDGLAVEAYALENGQLSLRLPAAYERLSAYDRTLTAAALVLTLCQLDGVEAVTLYVADKVQMRSMTARDFMLYDQEADPYERQVTLYFTDSGGRYLYGDGYTFTTSADMALEAYVMEELIRGPKDASFVSALPPDTAVNRIYIDENICYVDLSAAFFENCPGTVLGERMAVYAVVNSLTGLTGIDAVQFLKDGEMPDKLLYLPMNAPIDRNDRTIRDGSGSLTDASIYLWAESAGKLAEIPVLLEPAEGVNVRVQEFSALQILNALIDCKDELGYSNLISADFTLNSLKLENGVCILDFSGAFFTMSADDSADAVQGFLQAAAASLTSISGINGFRVLVEGKRRLLDGEAPSGIYYPDTKLLLE